VSLPHIEADEDFLAVITECDRLLTVKGRDYTQGDSVKGGHARLKNFYRNAEKLGVHARTVLAIYLAKHLDAIETFLRHGQVESEPIDGRICDAINYLLLLAKMIRVERRDDEDDAVRAAK
jgi:hypothetical protein